MVRHRFLVDKPPFRLQTATIPVARGQQAKAAAPAGRAKADSPLFTPRRPLCILFLKNRLSLSNFFKGATGAIPIISISSVSTPSPGGPGEPVATESNRGEHWRRRETRGTAVGQWRQWIDRSVWFDWARLESRGDAFPWQYLAMK